LQLFVPLAIYALIIGTVTVALTRYFTENSTLFLIIWLPATILFIWLDGVTVKLFPAKKREGVTRILGDKIENE